MALKWLRHRHKINFVQSKFANRAKPASIAATASAAISTAASAVASAAIAGAARA